MVSNRSTDQVTDNLCTANLGTASRVMVSLGTMAHEIVVAMTVIGMAIAITTGTGRKTTPTDGNEVGDAADGKTTERDANSRTGNSSAGWKPKAITEFEGFVKVVTVGD